jgi:heat-inducible transcriptional repressor
MGETEQALDERKSAILRAIVEEYIASAQPVGSQTIAHTRELGVSAATVRNEMGALEREGYIAQPHTSAGRIPTDKGYRFYVDRFPGAGALPASQRREVADFFMSAVGVMDDLLHDTSQLLARLTSHAAVVVGPQADVAVVCSVTLVRLQSRVVLAVIVLSNGAVEKEHVVLDRDVSDDDVAVANTVLSQHLLGSTFSGISAPPKPTANQTPDGAHLLAADVCDALRRSAAIGSEPLFVGGASRLAAEHEAFSNAQVAARLLELLEEHVVMVAVMRELLGPGVTVRIGSEHDRDDLRDCSVVLAPYLVEGQPGGTVGVLGPTRMDYRQARAAVLTVSRQLSRSLSHPSS